MVKACPRPTAAAKKKVAKTKNVTKKKVAKKKKVKKLREVAELAVAIPWCVGGTHFSRQGVFVKCTMCKLWLLKRNSEGTKNRERMCPTCRETLRPRHGGSGVVVKFADYLSGSMSAIVEAHKLCNQYLFPSLRTTHVVEIDPRFHELYENIQNQFSKECVAPNAVYKDVALCDFDRGIEFANFAWWSFKCEPYSNANTRGQVRGDDNLEARKVMLAFRELLWYRKGGVIWTENVLKFFKSKAFADLVDFAKECGYEFLVDETTSEFYFVIDARDVGLSTSRERGFACLFYRPLVGHPPKSTMSMRQCLNYAVEAERVEAAPVTLPSVDELRTQFHMPDAELAKLELVPGSCKHAALLEAIRKDTKYNSVDELADDVVIDCANSPSWAKVPVESTVPTFLKSHPCNCLYHVGLRRFLCGLEHMMLCGFHGEILAAAAETAAARIDWALPGQIAGQCIAPPIHRAITRATLFFFRHYLTNKALLDKEGEPRHCRALPPLPGVRALATRSGQRYGASR
mmetsp:Transcript_29447/g.90090  ORF Transcript_29447/g.90090 Transcript_29447/m.90090 type:complete len:516 (+) Transcript_29447:165-1712(+)